MGRYFFDGGGKKRQKYCVMVDAQGDEGRNAAEVVVQLYWWDNFENAGKTLEKEYTVSRQKTADTVYGELLGMFEKAGFLPADMEQEELHVLIGNAIREQVRLA